jgi:hypothetical protein
MADDVAATLFTEARAHHDAARRWFCIAAATLAIFHLMIYRPYIDLTGKKAEAASALAHETTLKQELDGMEPELARLSALSTEEAKRRLDGLLADLRNTFGRLNGILAELRSMGPDRASGEPGEQLFAPAEYSSMVIQMPAPIANAMATTAGAPMRVESHLPAMNGLLRRDIAGANSLGSILGLIKPYIDQEIITPRFSRFNESWREEVAPGVASAGDALLLRIRTAGSRFPGEAASWTSAEHAVTSVVSAARQFKIEPPSERFWWAAVEGKGAAIQGFLRTFNEHALDDAAALAELLQRTEAAIDANKQRQKEIDALIARLTEEFREQQNELAALVEPLKGIAIDLATIVRYFPVVLGVSFVALTVWLASRIQELGEAVALVARGDPASPAPEWLRRRVTASPWHRRASIFARCIVLAAWVALASWELAGVSLAGRAEAVLFGLAGAIGIASASGYEWRVVQSLGDAAGGG